MPSTEQLSRAFSLMLAVTESIREAGRIPSGTLYAVLLDRVTLEGYESMVSHIVGTGLVRRDGHELVWVGE